LGRLPSKTQKGYQTKFDMSKVQKFNVESILDGASKTAPFIAMITAIGAFTLVGVFKADYYTGVLFERWAAWSIVAGASIALVTELSRAVLLLMSFKDFREGKTTAGIWGMFLSIGLVIYDCVAAGPISSLWTGGSGESLGLIIRDVVVFLVVLSFGIELRLSISGKKRSQGPQINSKGDNGQSSVIHYNGAEASHNANNGPVQNRAKIGFKLPESSVATGDNRKVLELALKGAKSYYSAYKNKPDTDNNKQKRKQYKQQVEQLQRMIEKAS
jgi:hypothetical protein